MKRKTSYLKNTVLIVLLTLYITGCKTEKNGKATGEAVADTSWALLPFIKVDSVNPILQPGDNKFVCPVAKREIKWDEKDVFNPAAVVREGKVYMIFRAEDKVGKFAGTSRLGLAVSDDAITFRKLP